MNSIPRVLIKRGNLTGTAGAQAAPASGATITIFDSTTAPQWSIGMPFQRLVFVVLASHDSAVNGVSHLQSVDKGTNFNEVQDESYTAATGLMTFDFPANAGHSQITYENSANTLTAWRYELWGVYDRAATT